MAKIRVKVERVETYSLTLTIGETYTVESGGTGSRKVTGRVIGRDGRDLLLRDGKKIMAVPMARIKNAYVRGVLSPTTPIPVPAQRASTNGTQKAARKKAVRRATRKAISRRGVARV